MDGVLFYPTLLAVVKAVVFLSLCDELFSFMPQKKTHKKLKNFYVYEFFWGAKKIKYWIPQIKLT
jgi:hypothetical protein